MIKKEQIDNLLMFSFLFSEEMGLSINLTSPSYFEEKWKRYIGTSIKNKELSLNYTQSILEWKEIWSVKTDKYDRMMDLILTLNDSKLPHFDLETLLNSWSNYVDIKKINDYTNNGLHPWVKDQIDRFLNIKVNKRIYSLLQLEIN